MGNISKVEELEQQIADAGINLYEYPFKSDKLKGITYITKGQKNIGISKKVNTMSERLTILSEELSHCEISCGNVTADNAEERKARFKSYDKLVGLEGLIKAYEYGCTDLYEFADYFDVTYDFLIECLRAYQDRYNMPKKINNFKISFHPTLSIEKITMQQ